MSLRSSLLIAAVLASSAIACVGASDPEPGSTNVAAGESKLTMEVVSEARLAGRMGNVTFESVRSEEGVYELTVKVNGMTLDGTIDFANHTSSLDGFGSTSGDDTAMRDEDREVVAKLYRAFNDELPKELPEAGVVLRRALGLWGENSPTVRLDRLVYGDEGRGYTMLCSYAKCGDSYTGSCASWNWYANSKHDCYNGGFDTASNQQVAQLGDHYYPSGDEYYYSSTGWKDGEPDHWTRPYVVGGCWGRCGGGCGGDTQYTLDATNHDGCVRNGHALASLYCDDQFTSASDDEMFAPNCY